MKPKAKPAAPAKSATPESDDDDYSAEFAAPKAAPAKKASSAPAGRGRAAAGGERKASKPGASGRPGAAASAGASRKKGEEVDTSPLFVASNLKNVR